MGPAAGADIKEMQPKTFAGNYLGKFLEAWTKIADVQKPIIAAVNGHALGPHLPSQRLVKYPSAKLRRWL